MSSDQVAHGRRNASAEKDASNRTGDWQQVALAAAVILQHCDPDPDREGLIETPSRVARMYEELTRGYDQDPKDVLTFFEPDGYDEMILQRDIPVRSLCEHHLLPFVGKAHVGYVPNGKIVGLSKLVRLVEIFARRFQVQERLTAQVADAMMEYLEPLGAICVIEAEHHCMAMRGVNRPDSTTMTSAVRGVFRDTPEARSEAMSLIQGRQS